MDSRTPYHLTLTDDGDESLRQEILAPLVDFNTSQVGPSGNRPLVVRVDSPQGQVLGGLWGYTGYGWLFTQLLVVPEALRGRGLGRQVLQMAEQEARTRGCHGAWLDTFEFQARGFYEGLGYECFGELSGYPPGFSRYFMKKAL